MEKSLRACELSRWQSSRAVDALGAAYAEIGDFTCGKISNASDQYEGRLRNQA